MNNGKIINRLKRAEGQVKAVRKMYEDDKDCLDIIQQLTASRSALNKVAVIILKKELDSCYRGEEKEKLDAILKNIINLN